MPRTKLENAESRLLAAGLSLFAKHGTERVNSNTIARRARLGIGTFYSHFPDKHALLREIELRTLAGIREARLAAIGKAGADPIDQARSSIEAAVQFAERHPEAYRVTLGRERVGSARHGPIVSESSRPTAEALRQLQRRNQLAADLDVDLAARAYLSMEVGTLLWWLEDPSRASPAALVDTLARLHPLSKGALRDRPREDGADS
jgi:AcrR family transcriptional regulator